MYTKKIISTLIACAFCLGAFAKTEPTIDVMPYPQSVEIGKGTFNARGAAVNCDAKLSKEMQQLISTFAHELTITSGKVSSFASPIGLAKIAGEGSAKGFAFVLNQDLEMEEYAICINEKSAVVSASSYNGFFYAIQTLKQMLPAQIYGKEAAPKAGWKMVCCTIKDKPRFAYRGMHLDCSRHFFSLQEVKKYLDVMAMYKLNRFHWHLTDDQGWRVEIKSHPELTAIGGYRNGTVIKKDWNSNDGIRYGGYYTQDQIKEIIDYAAKKCITVIPEIDLPGHMLGVLAAHPELGCTGGPYEVWQRWGISDDVLCIGKEETFKMLEEILTEVAELFPSEYLHIGGDECPKTKWHDCPLCQARIAELGLVSDEHGSAEQYLQNYVTSRVQTFLEGKGKRIIGWDEILEGDLKEGATVMSWRGTSGGIEAANRGFDVIMTPHEYCYLDYYQSQDHEKEPFGIGGFLPVEKTYGYNPTEGLDENAAAHILGAQCNLWTEYVATDEHLEYMLLPRMQAISEVQWCEDENKSFQRFAASLESHQFTILELLGYNYRPLDK